MIESVLEKAMKNLKTALENIKAANGYNNTVKTVQRFAPATDIEGRAFNTVLEVPAIFIQQGVTEVLSESGDEILKSTQVHIGYALRIDTNQDKRPEDEILNAFSGDIEKCLKIDFIRGGNAIDTKFLDEDLIPVEEGRTEIGREMVFELTYKHKWNDPFTA